MGTSIGVRIGVVPAPLSSSGTIVVDSPRQREVMIESEDWELGTLWTPCTLDTRTRLISEQCSRLTERQAEREMAETNNLEKMLQLMLTMN